MTSEKPTAADTQSGHGRQDGCLRCLIFSGVGAILFPIVVFALCLTVETVGDASQDLLLDLGLNPREEAIVCLVVLAFLTSLAGMVLGLAVMAAIALYRRKYPPCCERHTG